MQSADCLEILVLKAAIGRTNHYINRDPGSAIFAAQPERDEDYPLPWALCLLLKHLVYFVAIGGTPNLVGLPYSYTWWATRMESWTNCSRPMVFYAERNSCGFGTSPSQ